MNYNHHISKPCTADLSKMSATERGVFCTLCQKEVVDFRDKSNQEIDQYTQSLNGAKACGIFNEKQVTHGKIGEAIKNIRQSSVNRYLKNVLAFLLLGVMLMMNCTRKKPIHKQGKYKSIDNGTNNKTEQIHRGQMLKGEY
jgi:hypothetical protein